MVGIGVSEARREFSRLLHCVQGGDRIVITRRGKPVTVP